MVDALATGTCAVRPDRRPHSTPAGVSTRTQTEADYYWEGIPPPAHGRPVRSRLLPVQVLTGRGLVTYEVLLFLPLESRPVTFAGIPADCGQRRDRADTAERHALALGLSELRLRLAREIRGSALGSSSTLLAPGFAELIAGYKFSGTLPTFTESVVDDSSFLEPTFSGPAA
jgi:hypothetical protein